MLGACKMLNRSLLRGRVPFGGARLSSQSRAIVTHTNSDNAQTAVTVKPNINDLAKMAQLNISEQEALDWSPKINSVLDWFGQLQSVDVQGLSPAIHAYSEGNRLRPDEPQHYPSRSQLLAQAPQTEATYVRVPKTAGGEGEAAVAPEPSNTTTAAPAAPATAATAATATVGVSDSSEASGALPSVPAEALHALDIRVGRILSCERHPDAESLYVERIDVGEQEPRTIVSGLVKYVPLEEMQNRLVLVLCNLKPRNMRGIKSFGMLLAASNEAHTEVEPLAPPSGARPGERVWFGEESAQAPAADPKIVDKRKYWEAVQPLLRTDPSCVAGLVQASGSTAAMMTSVGPVRAASLTGARIA